MGSPEVQVKLTMKKSVVENRETRSLYPNLALPSFKVCPLFSEEKIFLSVVPSTYINVQL
jgi:hypothetical protein